MPVVRMAFPFRIACRKARMRNAHQQRSAIAQNAANLADRTGIILNIHQTHGRNYEVVTLVLDNVERVRVGANELNVELPRRRAFTRDTNQRLAAIYSDDVRAA